MTIAAAAAAALLSHAPMPADAEAPIQTAPAAAPPVGGTSRGAPAVPFRSPSLGPITASRLPVGIRAGARPRGPSGR